MIRHSWDISPAEAIRLQRKLASRVRVEPLAAGVETVAGTDCAFLSAGGHSWGRGRSAGGVQPRILTVAVLCDAKSMEVIATAHDVRPCRFPYVPGLLSFREAPSVIAAVGRLPRRPDLLLCDGQGVAHPRGLGLASHVGLWLDLPTIGVAKSRLCGAHRPPGLRRRCRAQLRHEGRAIGAVLRTRDGVQPVYVSVGHRVTLDDAVRWTLRCGRGVRLPEPTRLAHQRVSMMKKDAQAAQASRL